MPLLKFVLVALLAVVLATAVLILYYALTALRPGAAAEPVTVAATRAAGEVARPAPGSTLRVMSWNIQYAAGKGYTFFYDTPEGDGPDTRPSEAAVARTLPQVARIIADEAPDILLLQEVDEGARRTYGIDQWDELRRLLDDAYPFWAEAFYWRAGFVPHPKVFGAVGMKLVTASRYPLAEAVRHPLPVRPVPFWERPFTLKRAVLEVAVPLANGSTLAVFNTHLDAFARGTTTMEEQVSVVMGLVGAAEAEGHPWILGGDFNLLPPGQFGGLSAASQGWFDDPTALLPMFGLYPSVPTVAEANGPEASSWYTHRSNDPRVPGPDKTIDYLFHSPAVERVNAAVRQADTAEISDHFPVLADLRLPGGAE